LLVKPPEDGLHQWEPRGGIWYNNAMSLKFNVTLDRDEDGAWVVECPAIPGCVSQGQTRDEALENIEDAIRLCLEVRAERGLPLTRETRQVEIAA
jgi:predicted RNase H-like HicB family nuclease